MRCAPFRSFNDSSIHPPPFYNMHLTSEVILSLTDSAYLCTLLTMKFSISEARKRLPELVRQVRKDAGAKVEITVRDEVVAELRAALPEPEPGAAAKKLVALMRRLPKHRGRKTDVSAHVKEYLHGSGAKSR
jgi:antitoxin (DNA-binding transcriptional repressor) of toxin-antitoxin stability system